MRKPYPLYKDSGIEHIKYIPVAWTKIKLKYTIKNIITGIWGNEPADDDNDLKCVRVNDFDYERLTLKNNEFTTRNIIFNGNNDQSILQKNDLLIEKSGGGEKSPVGRVVLYNNKVKDKCVCSNFIALLRSEPDKYDPKFLVYLHSNLYAEKINTRSIKQTTGIQNLDISSYLNEIIAIPGIIEQQGIISYLDYKTILIDELIEKTKQKIDLLKEKRTSLINHCVTKGLNPDVEMKDSGIEWIGEIPKHWNCVRVRHISTVKRGASPRPIEDPKYFDDNGEYSWVRISDVSNSNRYLHTTTQKLSELGSSLSQKLEEDEIFMSISGSVGKVMISKIKCCIHDGFVTFKNPKINKIYLYYIFSNENLYKKFGLLGTQVNINSEIVGNLYLPIPTSEEQQKIAEYLDSHIQKIDTLIEKENNRIELLKEYRQSLISEAVTGKIDVREEVAV